ncbi:Vacuolar protein sorting/targeting protein 10 [Labeo rohita]|uniref:Vacuolar protein sorting/targeting protein 10 n=1 Tax=Labeo rohita TaxID=84645 RepID=A0ABQ8L601_LABRO|nr:Vacuolar protein sorting/targeting protein 10 [Labeo rohita]
MYSEEKQSLSGVTFMVKESLAGATAGIKKVQPVFSVIDRNTHSVLLMSLTHTVKNCCKKTAKF